MEYRTRGTIRTAYIPGIAFFVSKFYKCAYCLAVLILALLGILLAISWIKLKDSGVAHEILQSVKDMWENPLEKDSIGQETIEDLTELEKNEIVIFDD